MTITLMLPADLAPIAATRQFSAYGPSHWTVLVVFAIGSAALVWIGRRQTESQARLLGRVLGALTIAIFSVALVYKLVQPAMAHSVPLQLCDLAELTAAYALWSQRKWAFALAYYWGLPLSSQALITPDLNASDFPSHSFLTFFALHLLVVWAAIYLTWGYGMRPGWRSYRFAVITTLGWGAFTFMFNTIAATDYGFLNRKPLNASLLDFLGPWPFYVLAEVVTVGAVWALMTWPWELKRRRQSSMSIGVSPQQQSINPLIGYPDSVDLARTAALEPGMGWKQVRESVLGHRQAAALPAAPANNSPARFPVAMK